MRQVQTAAMAIHTVLAPKERPTTDSSETELQQAAQDMPSRNRVHHRSDETEMEVSFNSNRIRLQSCIKFKTKLF